MGLEDATYISQLTATNPTESDPVSRGDDHLRLIKEVLQAQFTTLGAAAVSTTAAELNLLDGVTTLAPEGTAVLSTSETGTTKFLRVDGDNSSSWQVPPDTNTTYTAGDGLDLTGTAFSTDLLSNGGLEIQSTELSVAQGISQYDVAQFAAGVVDDDFLKISTTSVEGRSASEVLSDIAALPLAGGAMTGAITTNSTFDGVDVDACNTLAVAALPKSGGTMTGEINAADQLVTRPEMKDYSETVVALSAAATVDIDLTGGNVFTLTPDQNTTFTFSNPSGTGKSCSFTLIWTQGGSDRTIQWPTEVDWKDGSEPDVTSGSGKIDIYTFFTIDAGTIWYGFQAGTDMSTPS